eukprot:1200759-Ditylum_brightwellii.AAC.1
MQGPANYVVAKTLLKGDALTATQIQKRYMQRNICYQKDNTMKEWVARVQELNRYLKDFPEHNGNPTQPVDVDELFVEFCTPLESCEPSKVEPKGKTPSKSKTPRKRKAK